MSDLSGNASGLPNYGTQPPPWASTSAPNPSGAPYQYGVGGMPPVVAPPKKRLSPRTIIGIVVVVIIVVAGIAWAASGNVSASNIKVGACFTDTSGDTVSTVKTVACTKPHDSEVFLNQVVSSSTYPTSDEWDGFVEQYCLPAFVSYDGIDYNDSNLDISYFYPDPTGWSQGDKTLTCYATDSNGGLTSSIKGSNR